MRRRVEHRAEASGSKRVKLVHVIEHAKGGTATYLSDLLLYAVRDTAFEHVIVAERDAFPDELERYRGHVRFYEMRRSAFSMARAVRSVRAILLAESPDLVHTHGSFAGVVGRLAAVGLPCRKIHCAHGWSFTQDVRWTKLVAFALVEYLLARSTDAIINISRYEAQRARRYGVLGRVADYTIPHSTHPASTSDAPSDAIRVPGSHNLIFAGRFDRQKGVDRLLSAWQDVRPTRAVLHVFGEYDRDVGSGDRPKLAGVRFHGWASRERLLAAMRDCEIFVMPSRWEGFGLVAIEAMSQGNFLIVSSAGSLPELVVHGANGYVFDTDEDLRAILRRIESIEPETIRAAGELNREIFNASFRWPLSQARTFDVYRRLSGRKQRVQAEAPKVSSVPELRLEPAHTVERD